jgi:hypothetical protein
MTLPKYLYDPDNYVEVLGNFNKIGSAAVTAASRIYLSKGGGALLPTTIPGLVIAHNCYWLPLFHAWLVDDIMKPATILISGFNGAQSTLWIDPSTAFFGIWNDSMWQSSPPTGAQLLSMPGAGSFRTSNNFDWTFPRVVVKEVSLYELASSASFNIIDPIGAYTPSLGLFMMPPGVLGDFPVSLDYATFALSEGYWNLRIPQGSVLGLTVEVMVDFAGVLATANTVIAYVGTKGEVLGTDRKWTPPYNGGTSDITIPVGNVASLDNGIQILTIPLLFFVSNYTNEYYLRIQHQNTVTISRILGIRVVYLEAGLRGL